MVDPALPRAEAAGTTRIIDWRLDGRTRISRIPCEGCSSTHFRRLSVCISRETHDLATSWIPRMAVNRTQQSGLTIALIVFVMLTFVLAAATYFGFTGRQKALDDRASADKQSETAANEVRQARQDLETLRNLIGVPPETPIADIETGLGNLFEGDFAGFDRDSKSYTTLIGWLRDEFRDLAGKVKTVEQDKQVLASQSGADAVRIQQELEQWKKQAESAEAAQASQKQEFDQRWSELEKKETDLLAQLDKAEGRARELQALAAEIAKGLDFMPPTRRQAFSEALNTQDSIKQLELIRTLLREQAQAIERFNRQLAELRVADPTIQQLIAAAIPADDRIDGFDGRLVDIDPRSSTVLITSRSTAGLRPGLVLHVFDPEDPRPEFGSRKAVVQVTEIESSTLARASILREDVKSPMLPGDGVSSSLWSTGTAPEVVIVGFTDVDGDGRSDLQMLTDLIQRAGGRIQAGVTASTAMVVDLGSPPGSNIERLAPEWPAEEKRRERTLNAAKTYGTRVASTAVLLDMLGLDADSFAAGRFPQRRSIDRLPPNR